MGARCGMTWSLVILAAASAQAFESVIQMRNNCTLIVNNTSQPDAGETAAALANLRFSAGVGGQGLNERADYASGYVSNNTQFLVGGRNILQSNATVMANNTRVYVSRTNRSLSYTGLDLQLDQNNTLEFDAGNVNLDLSTLALAQNNWFLMKNGSRLQTNNTAITYSDFFTWYVERSTVVARNSAILLKNMLAWFEGSTFNVDRSTFNITSDNPVPPARYEQLSPVLWINNSRVNVTLTDWRVTSLPKMHVSNSNFSLFNSSLTVKDTTWHLFSDSLDITRSNILCDNSTIVLYSKTATKHSVTAVQGPGFVNVTAGQPLVGQPLGRVNVVLGGQDMDISL